MEILEFGFGNRHGVRLGGKFLNWVDMFKYLGSVVQENEGIADVASRIKCGWIRSRDGTGVLYEVTLKVKEVFYKTVVTSNDVWIKILEFE